MLGSSLSGRSDLNAALALILQVPVAVPIAAKPVLPVALAKPYSTIADYSDVAYAPAPAPIGKDTAVCL